MPRVAAAPPPVLPNKLLHETTAFRVVVVVAFLVVGSLVFVHIKELNRRHQIERRLELDVRVNDIVRRMRAEVRENKDRISQSRYPVGLYVGQANYTEGRLPQGNDAPTRTLELKNAILLEGRPGKSDAKTQVTISVKTKPDVVPRQGEWWIVSVVRDAALNNTLHEGLAWEPSKP